MMNMIFITQQQNDLKSNSELTGFQQMQKREKIKELKFPHIVKLSVAKLKPLGLTERKIASGTHREGNARQRG